MAQRIAVVGNGEVEAGSAALIDACDLVVRFNFCRSYGASGTKSDVVAVCNTGRPGKAMVSSQEWLSHPAVQSASEIWSVRDGGKFNAMKPDVLANWPELEDFFEDFTGDFAKIAERRGKVHRVIAREVHEAVDEQLLALTHAPYVCPSSGMVVLAHILENIKQPDDEVLIAGFTHQGWELHPFDAEKKLIDGWVAAGDLIRV